MMNKTIFAVAALSTLTQALISDDSGAAVGYWKPVLV